MINRTLKSIALSTLMLGGSAAAVLGGATAFASAPDGAAIAKAARAQAGSAGEALAKGSADDAVRFAEAAVTLNPKVASYRVLLGQSYLKAGRFASARAAFTDALSLDAGNGKAALNLALVETGLGDWAAAREVLTSHGETVPAADRGLGIALAGDPTGAVEILTAAVRSPDATVKTRQNLALAMALAGRWAEARVVAGMDLSPADLDARMEQWAAFAHPTGAADQVAMLLGVTPVEDSGQPVALALVTAPVRVADSAPVATPVTAVDPAIAAVPATSGPVFAAASAVVQPLPAAPAVIKRVVASPAAYKVAVKAAAARVADRAKGKWFVQIGAYATASVARDDWARATRRDAAFRGLTPDAMTFQAKGAQVYRVSVGGFARGEADALCRSFRVKGGRCFVRQGAGEQIASWARKDVQLASR